jgi:transcriptional regulator with XRE-family HTH domain
MRSVPDAALLKALAAVVKARRGELAISQEELAHRASMNRTFVGKLELAKTQPSLGAFFRLSEALEVEAPEMTRLVAARWRKELRAARRPLEAD